MLCRERKSQERKKKSEIMRKKVYSLLVRKFKAHKGLLNNSPWFNVVKNYSNSKDKFKNFKETWIKKSLVSYIKFLVISNSAENRSFTCLHQSDQTAISFFGLSWRIYTYGTYRSYIKANWKWQFYPFWNNCPHSFLYWKTVAFIGMSLVFSSSWEGLIFFMFTVRTLSLD